MRSCFLLEVLRKIKKKPESCTFPKFCIVSLGIFGVIEYFEMNALFNCLLKAL